MWKMPARRMFPLAVLALASPYLAWAKCCPGGGHGIELASVGLGESNPQTADMSLDARWRVHGFERDSISYFQVNDQKGNIQLILGKALDQYWVLPAGAVHLNIELPSDRSTSIAPPSALEVYRHPDFSLLVSESEGMDRWWVLRTTDSP